MEWTWVFCCFVGLLTGKAAVFAFRGRSRGRLVPAGYWVGSYRVIDHFWCFWEVFDSEILFAVSNEEWVGYIKLVCIMLRC